MPPPAICMVNEGIGRPSTDPNQGHHLTSPEGRTLRRQLDGRSMSAQNMVRNESDVPLCWSK
jgi:hypothetical protein